VNVRHAVKKAGPRARFPFCFESYCGFFFVLLEPFVDVALESVLLLSD